MTTPPPNFVLLSRPSCHTMDSRLGLATPVLDHGFIRIIDYMGNEASIVQAARVSYGTGTKTPNEDDALIRYLMRHHHTTPFEMCSIKVHVKLPIFVARQWIRHRMAHVNEYSARYSILRDEFYIPTPASVGVQSTTNRQGRQAPANEFMGQVEDVLGTIKEASQEAHDVYADLLNDTGRHDPPHDPDRISVSREQARMILPLNTYTEWYWKTDLHNLMNFLRLRADSHAQEEIRAYAFVLMDILRMWMPSVYSAFIDTRMRAFTLTGNMVDALSIALEAAGMLDLSKNLYIINNMTLTRREREELIAAFKPVR